VSGADTLLPSSFAAFSGNSHLPDHLVVIVFALLYPIVGFIGFRRLLRRIEAGIPVNRNLLYFNTILGHWILFVIALCVWAISERAWGDLGFNFVFNSRFIVGAVLTVAGIAFLLVQLRQATTASREEIDLLQHELGHLSLLIPRNGSEMARFNLLSLSAGIVEETLWRGFLIWYLSQSVPVWAAAIISAVGFGVAHAYQGLANVPKITLVGAVFSGLYVLSGSLWLPMILHATVDLIQGRLAYEVLRPTSSDNIS
jgi:membrane protease YdiL (CAAX protease family)